MARHQIPLERARPTDTGYLCDHRHEHATPLGAMECMKARGTWFTILKVHPQDRLDDGVKTRVQIGHPRIDVVRDGPTDTLADAQARTLRFQQKHDDERLLDLAVSLLRHGSRRPRPRA